MFRFFKSITIISLISGVFCLGFWGPIGIFSPGLNDIDVTVIIPRHSGLMDIAQNLQDKSVVPFNLTFVACVLASGERHSLKAGEYSISPHMSPYEIMTMMVEGRVVRHQITIPEGYTVAQVISLIEDIPILEGKIEDHPSEGHILPETYEYLHGDSRQGLLDKMQTSMDKLLPVLWNERAQDLPLKTPEEALILASIVEKETGIGRERAHIAGVFYNRLLRRMPLQSDPTVIYGLTKGKTDFARDLIYKDLQSPTAHNTYKILGLPPTPIACPGREALKAVLNPEKTSDFYFVADGTGGHVFSEKFSDHCVKVKKWHNIKRVATASQQHPNP